MQISEQKIVTLEYILTDNTGTILDATDGREAFAYLHGARNIIPGLEAALEGRSAGEKLQVTIPPEEAYGERQEGLIQSIPRDRFEGVETLEIGMQFHAGTPQGPQVVTVTAIEGDEVTIDANHPLAGTTLNFDVTITDIRDATEEELSHGHVHGPGGHAHD